LIDLSLVSKPTQRQSPPPKKGTNHKKEPSEQLYTIGYPYSNYVWFMFPCIPLDSQGIDEEDREILPKYGYL